MLTKIKTKFLSKKGASDIVVVDNATTAATNFSND